MKLPALGATARTATAVLLTAAGLGGCADDPIAADLRSLHSSGPMAFLCLNAATDDPVDFALPLDRCSGHRSNGIDDFSIPHLYALVTQSVRGEIAVVDLTTDSGAVLDQDPVTPGANFLPVGAQPTDIVSTPGSMASFVAVSEPAFEGIYALPSTMVRATAARLSSWPSCSLPATPGHMILSLDPPDDSGDLRPSCDADYGDDDASTCGPDGEPHCHGDLSAEAAQTARAGRYKLIVTLPDEGGFAVIDAQNVLDREAGEFAPCTIERWVPLDVTVPSPPPWPEAVEEACVNEDLGDPGPYASAFVPRPEALVHDADRLYIADSAAPIIHVVDLPTPCEPIERPGLLPRSVEDPSRVVTTSQLALSPPTLDFRRYLYALDLIDGSLMVFDVSDESTTNVPLERPDAELNPFQPSDRIRFQAPPRAVVSVQHLNDEHDSNSGANIPLRCDPDLDSTGEGTVYRTSDAYDSGAGPLRLRGVFSFVVLASGDIVVIDVDDYDAPCRGPNDQHSLLGCGDGDGEGLVTSSEYSCKTVTPHQPRAAGYLVQISDIAANQPGLQAFPVLFDDEGTALTIDEETSEGKQPPRLRATVPTEVPPSFTLAVGADLRELDPQTGELRTTSDRPDPSEHTVAMNLEDPRAHILNQRWSVTFEGALPGFGGRYAHLVTNDAGETFELTDPSSIFCDTGVRSEQAVHDILVAQQDDPQRAAGLADYVQIISSLPVETDGYWQEQAECSYTECRNAYGTVDQPNTTRDLRIVEAWSDHLALEPRHNLGNASPLKCCFPGVVEFSVRPGHQWTVIGDGVGFLHHMVEDPDTGTCRDSCDPTLVRRDGRAQDNAYDDASAQPVEDGSPGAFMNPFFRFAVIRGRECTEAGACTDRPSQRDTQFQFVTQGAFTPLTLSVVGRDVNVQPQAIEYLTPTGELVISDGSLEGITFLDLNRLTINRQYN